MTKHLQIDLDELSKELLTMGAMVEEATNRAIITSRARLLSRRTSALRRRESGTTLP